MNYLIRLLPCSEDVPGYKRNSVVTEYNYLYNPLPILIGFPSRRPSMCVITDQLLEQTRAAKGSSQADVDGRDHHLSVDGHVNDIDSD